MTTTTTTPMTLADLSHKSAALEALRLQWLVKILPIVEDKLDDAEAHATKAVTKTLRATPDGRPTARRANLSPSFRAAIKRLDELLDLLAGPKAWSLDGSIRDARAAFYRRAFALHKPLIPPSLLIRPDPQPTIEGIRLVRGALIHGYDLRREIEGPIATAQRNLTAAVAQAASRSADDQVLSTWRKQALSAIRAVVVRAVTDSVEYADTEAGTDLIHPDHLEEE